VSSHSEESNSKRCVGKPILSTRSTPSCPPTDTVLSPKPVLHRHLLSSDVASGRG